MTDYPNWNPHEHCAAPVGTIVRDGSAVLRIRAEPGPEGGDWTRFNSSEHHRAVVVCGGRLYAFVNGTLQPEEDAP